MVNGCKRFQKRYMSISISHSHPAIEVIIVYPQHNHSQVCQCSSMRGHKAFRRCFGHRDSTLILFCENGLVMPKAVKRHLASYISPAFPGTSPLQASVWLSSMKPSQLGSWLPCSKISQSREPRTKINLSSTSSLWYFVITTGEKKKEKENLLSYRLETT